ncbi:MAG: hypothetical protein PWP51_734 [Clostridiales bacterium]|jgi:hypothetical protein|nr:hypothetical protein [Clostridiales bacterium]MDN5298181.1 hypothetical protein [Clostridiales bacterium]
MNTIMRRLVRHLLLEKKVARGKVVTELMVEGTVRDNEGGM